MSCGCDEINNQSVPINSPSFANSGDCGDNYFTPPSAPTTVNWGDIQGKPDVMINGDAAGGDLTGTYPSPTLKEVLPIGDNTFGDSVSTLRLEVDKKGRIKDITVLPILFPPTVSLSDVNQEVFDSSKFTNTTTINATVNDGVSVSFDVNDGSIDINKLSEILNPVTVGNLPVANLTTFTNPILKVGKDGRIYSIQNGVNSGGISGTVSDSNVTLNYNSINGVLTAGWNGVLPISRGGTGLSSIGNNGDVLTVTNAGTVAWLPPQNSGSVADPILAMPTEYNVVNAANNMTVTWKTANSNLFLATSATSNGQVPSLRAIVNSDLPDAVTAGTYAGVTVNTKGIVTAGTSTLLPNKIAGGVNNAIAFYNASGILDNGNSLFVIDNSITSDIKFALGTTTVDGDARAVFQGLTTSSTKYSLLSKDSAGANILGVRDDAFLSFGLTRDININSLKTSPKITLGNTTFAGASTVTGSSVILGNNTLTLNTDLTNGLFIGNTVNTINSGGTANGSVLNIGDSTINIVGDSADRIVIHGFGNNYRDTVGTFGNIFGSSNDTVNSFNTSGVLVTGVTLNIFGRNNKSPIGTIIGDSNNVNVQVSADNTQVPTIIGRNNTIAVATSAGVLHQVIHQIIGNNNQILSTFGQLQGNGIVLGIDNIGVINGNGAGTNNTLTVLGQSNRIGNNSNTQQQMKPVVLGGYNQLGNTVVGNYGNIFVLGHSLNINDTNFRDQYIFDNKDQTQQVNGLPTTFTAPDGMFFRPRVFGVGSPPVLNDAFGCNLGIGGAVSTTTSGRNTITMFNSTFAPTANIANSFTQYASAYSYSGVAAYPIVATTAPHFRDANGVTFRLVKTVPTPALGAVPIGTTNISWNQVRPYLNAILAALGNSGLNVIEWTTTA